MRCEEQLDITTLREALSEYKRQADLAEKLGEELARTRQALAAAQTEAAMMRPVFDALLKENMKIAAMIRAQSEMLQAGALQTAFPSTVYGAA